jgi:hypothetical protein
MNGYPSYGVVFGVTSPYLRHLVEKYSSPNAFSEIDTYQGDDLIDYLHDVYADLILKSKKGYPRLVIRLLDSEWSFDQSPEDLKKVVIDYVQDVDMFVFFGVEHEPLEFSMFFGNGEDSLWVNLLDRINDRMMGLKDDLVRYYEHLKINMGEIHPQFFVLNYN